VHNFDELSCDENLFLTGVELPVRLYQITFYERAVLDLIVKNLIFIIAI